MNRLLKIAHYVFLGLLLFGVIFLLYTQAKPFIQTPCAKPIEYVIGTIDPRFGVSREEVANYVAQSAALWNTAAGKTLFEEGEGGITVNLIYTEHQETTELGKEISAEQKAYNAQKVEVEKMKKSFNTAKDSVEKLQAAYVVKAKAYQEEVDYWNEQGGAPEADYKRLQSEQRSLEASRLQVNTAITALNELSADLNTEVDSLNLLADAINIRAEAFNEFAGLDYEQGQYREEKGEKTISIFEFDSIQTLKRVFAHEFGHALAIEHTQNPESIMYAYDIGDGFELTEEDIAALKKVCHIQ